MRRRAGTAKEPDWGTLVEQAYEAEEYAKALQILATNELLRPRSALIKLWQGRCHFQQEAWGKAAEKLEACSRLDPAFRKYVKDYMALIELNDLVPGLKGYLD